MSDAPAAPAAAAASLPLWRRVLPFVVGGLLVLWVALRIDYAAFVQAVGRTNYVGFAAFAFVFCTLLLAADASATAYVYGRTVAKVRFHDLFVIRAASYLPSMVNHHLGQAWLTYFLSRAYRAPLARAAGSMLLVYATTFGALFAFLLLGLPYNHGRVTWLAPLSTSIVVAGVAYLAFIHVKPGAFREKALLAPLFDVGVRGHLVALVRRMPHVVVQFVGAWVPFLFFDVDIPFTDALALMPILMFVVTLPVSPQGLGTRDALSLALLSGYAHGTPEERASVIAATTLSWLVVMTLVQLCISLLLLKRAHRLLGAGPATA